MRVCVWPEVTQLVSMAKWSFEPVLASMEERSFKPEPLRSYLRSSDQAVRCLIEEKLGIATMGNSALNTRGEILCSSRAGPGGHFELLVDRRASEVIMTQGEKSLIQPIVHEDSSIACFNFIKNTILKKKL